MIQDFIYHKPKSLDEALQMVSELEDCALIAGGQSSLITMREGMETPANVVDIKHLDELNYIKWDPKDGLRIGATTIHSDVEHSEAVRKNYTALNDAEDRLANKQIRNWGTMGGNIVHADPAEDPATCYLAFDAEVTLKSKKGSRTVPVSEFLQGFYSTCLEEDEILTEIHLPAPAPKTGSAFTKFTLLENDLGVASAAACITLDASGKCAACKLSVGCVSDKATRFPEFEAKLVGKAYDEKLFEEIGLDYSKNIDCLADIHATSETRQQEVAVLSKRMLKKAWERAKEA